MASNFTSAEKMNYRLRNLRWMRDELVMLWGEDGRLNADYCELSGESGGLTVELFEAHDVFGAGRVLVGVDRDPAFIAVHQARYPRHTWRAGELYTVFSDAEFDGVAVWNVDASSEVGSPRLEAGVKGLATRMRVALERHREIGFMLNCCLDTRRGGPVGSRVVAHAEMIAAAFTTALGRRRTVEPKLLLPPDKDVSLLDDPAYEDFEFGCFDVHCTRTLRMINLRLALV